MLPIIFTVVLSDGDASDNADCSRRGERSVCVRVDLSRERVNEERALFYSTMRERERENSLSRFLNEIAQNAVNWSKDPFLEDERRN